MTKACNSNLKTGAVMLSQVIFMLLPCMIQLMNTILLWIVVLLSTCENALSWEFEVI